MTDFPFPGLDFVGNLSDEWKQQEDPNFLYRIENSFSEDLPPWIDKIKILRVTPKGNYIIQAYNALRRQTVLACGDPGFKDGQLNRGLPRRFAYRTIDQALASYIIRQRWRQVHAQRELERSHYNELSAWKLCQFRSAR